MTLSAAFNHRLFFFFFFFFLYRGGIQIHLKKHKIFRHNRKKVLKSRNSKRAGTFLGAWVREECCTFLQLWEAWHLNPTQSFLCFALSSSAPQILSDNLDRNCHRINIHTVCDSCCELYPRALESCKGDALIAQKCAKTLIIVYSVSKQQTASNSAWISWKIKLLLIP